MKLFNFLAGKEKAAKETGESFETSSDLIMALRELDEAPKPTPKKAGASSKAILNQKYASKACYRIEEVNDESANNACPGLAVPQQGQIKFRCRLELPEFTVVSDVFTRKKDAEQAATKMALEKVVLQFSSNRVILQGFV
ncbi:Small RNA 2'-O-methyltransferase [Nymphaea thermarum]|nr:Small RNA 2'-O-methyltransferase [Nymphaea thermarum]